MSTDNTTATQLAAHPMLGEPAPAFRLASTNGQTFDLAEQRGKFVVIHFGTTW